MDKDELTNWALANGWQVIDGHPSLTKPSPPHPAIVRLVLKATVVNLEVKKPAGFPPDVRKVLQKIRETIRQAAPGAKERLSYNIPTFSLDRDIVHFGAFKEHIGLYPPVRVPALQARVTPYRGEKGNVRFPLNQPIPYDLIADIVKSRVETRGEGSNRKGRATKRPARKTR